jgi:ubiquinol-cytochrome c reductase cytochrome c subunit
VNSLSARRRHPVATFLVLFLGLLATGGIYAVFAPSNEAAAAAGGPVAQSIEEGHALFLANCATCHGLDAQGTSDGPSLVGVGAAAVSFQVGTGRMRASGPAPQVLQKPVSFSNTEVEQLAAYVASLGPGPAIPTDEQIDYSKGDVAEGFALFSTNCAMCHNFAGSGGALTRGKFAPPLTGVSPRHMYEAMLTGPQSMPVFNDATMPTEDKQSIIAYLKHIEGEPPVGGAPLGAIGPVSEGLFGWLVGIGALVGVAVWLGAKSS